LSLAIREYGYIACSDNESNGLDFVSTSPNNFAFLKKLALKSTENKELNAFRLVSRNGHEAVQARNLVGVLRLPDGQQLEILPKIGLGNETAEQGRQTLLRMLATVYELPNWQSGLASLNTLQQPWLELLITRFLNEAASLIRSGLRQSYQRVETESGFLKGQLRIAAQLRAPLGRAHRFQIRHDQFSTNRPENRLLHSTLIQLLRWSEFPSNQRVCRELLSYFDNIPCSQNINNDLKLWSNGRDMVRYATLRPWIRLILDNQSPIFSSGGWNGISLLFPMEMLFEQFVRIKLSKQIRHPYKLSHQISQRHLTKHNAQNWFQLKPDLMVSSDNGIHVIMDTKWKLIDSKLNNATDKYALKQSDMYQLFAYGKHYLASEGELFLIFPAHAGFFTPLSAFHFMDGLRLWVVPFDISSGQLITGDSDFLSLLSINENFRWIFH
jgi:5-methylcytosine-specific restriction enzyme subunit McrC